MRKRKKPDWLRIGEAEIMAAGHMSAGARQGVLNTVLTGDAVQRSQAITLLDAEKLVHAGYERLVTPEELATHTALLDVKNRPAGAVPPWPQTPGRP